MGSGRYAADNAYRLDLEPSPCFPKELMVHLPPFLAASFPAKVWDEHDNGVLFGL